MFLLIGAGPRVKEIGESQTMICPACGRFSRMTPYVERSELRLFFIPVFKWKKRYLAVAGCCGETFLLDPEVGRAIENGEPATINETFLLDPEVGRAIENGEPATINETNLEFLSEPPVLCEHCKKPVDTTHKYCPHCGKEI